MALPSPDRMAARVSLLAAVHARLLARGMAGPAEAVARLGVSDGPPDPGADRPPVVAHLPRALALAASADGALAGPLGALAADLRWTRTAAYRVDPPSPAFLDGYAHATVVGPADGTAVSGLPEVAVGVLLLGPGVHYPPHEHPADEVYLPLTAARWRDGTDAERPVPPGALLHHPSWRAHGIRTGDDPLLAVYVWTGDVRTASRWCTPGTQAGVNRTV